MVLDVRCFKKQLNRRLLGDISISRTLQGVSLKFSATKIRFITIDAIHIYLKMMLSGGKMVLVGRVKRCGGVGGLVIVGMGGVGWLGGWVVGVRDRGRRAGNVNNQPGLQPAL